MSESRTQVNRNTHSIKCYGKVTRNYVIPLYQSVSCTNLVYKPHLHMTHELLYKCLTIRLFLNFMRENELLSRVMVIIFPLVGVLPGRWQNIPEFKDNNLKYKRFAGGWSLIDGEWFNYEFSIVIINWILSMFGSKILPLLPANLVRWWNDFCFEWLIEKENCTRTSKERSKDLRHLDSYATDGTRWTLPISVSGTEISHRVVRFINRM